nr:helix-turn-helix domain-containing protein [Streptomyces sp. REN17]
MIGNHLAQHAHLSGLAIGLGVHIQSLPAGARVDIRTLTDRFPEGEDRIAAALRELEAHGYFSRTRHRLPSGQVVTRTVSYNQPGATPSEEPPPRPAPRTEPNPGPTPAAATAPAPAPAPDPVVQPPDSDARPSPAATVPAPGPVVQPPDTDVPPVPATILLAGLHRDDPRLLLSQRDVHRLAPAVSTWLDRGAAPEVVRRTLTAGLPEGPLHHPAGLLAHRLAELLPPPLPPAPPPVPAAARPLPLRNCDGCDRAFRSPEPGLRCRDCRSTASDLLEAA